jgi:hypothetical protein
MIKLKRELVKKLRKKQDITIENTKLKCFTSLSSPGVLFMIICMDIYGQIWQTLNSVLCLYPTMI